MSNVPEAGPPVKAAAEHACRLDGQLTPKLLAWIVETSGDAVQAVDLQGIVTVWNSAATELYGWTAAGKMVGRPLLERVPEAVRSRICREAGGRVVGRRKTDEAARVAGLSPQRCAALDRGEGRRRC